MEEKPRERSPRFPFIPLTQALQLAEKVESSVGGSKAYVSNLADDWGLSPTSSSTVRSVAALLAYGLANDEGSGSERRLQLTDRARRIIGDSRPGVRDALLSEAAMLPPLISSYYEKWGENRPSDGHAISTLKFDSHFNDQAAKTFLRVYDDALTYVAEADESKVEYSDTDSDEDEVDSQGRTGRELILYGDRHGRIREDSDSLNSSGAQPSPKEWLKVQVGAGTEVTLLVNSSLNAKMVERLITILKAQQAIMDDDF